MSELNIRRFATIQVVIKPCYCFQKMLKVANTTPHTIHHATRILFEIKIDQVEGTKLHKATTAK